VRTARNDADTEVSAEDVERVAGHLEQKIGQFADMRTKTTTIANNANAVIKIAEQLESLVREQIGTLRTLSDTMRQRVNRAGGL
jgi:hypothetical protein